MEKVKLGDVSKLINGDRGKNYPSQADITEDGEIPFVNAGHLNGREIDFSEMNFISQDKYDNLRSGKFQEGDILYCLRGSLGKKAFVSNDVNGAIASSLVIIRPDKEKVDGEYLMFALDSPAIKEQLVKANNGSSQPNLSAASVREYQVELPNISIQKEVVEKLIKVRNIIDCRRKELQLLDGFIKARFVEMFGDENNSLNWDIVNVEEVADVQVGVVIKPSQYYTEKENGVPAFRSLNIGEGTIKDTDWVYFTNEGHEKNSKSILKENDLLIVRSGAPGTACVVTKEYEGYNAIDIIIAHPDCSKVNPYYLCTYTNMPHGKKQIQEGTGGAAQQHFNVGKYNQLKLMLPPIERQNEFVDFIIQVNKSKSTIQKALDETQLLFDSLMQKYFG